MPQTPGAAPWSRRHGVAFVATAMAFAAVPWTVGPWPSQDGPNHLAVAHILRTYGDPGSPFPRYWDVQAGFRPSTALYSVLSLASRFLSEGTLEKCTVSFALAALPLALLLLARRAVPDRAANVLLSFPLLLGFSFAMGFLSFQVALAFGILALALGWEPRVTPADGGRLGWRHALASASYFLCVWWHPVVALMTGMVLLLLEWKALRRWTAWRRILVMVAPGAAFLVAAYLLAGASPGSSADAGDTHFSDPVSVLGAAFEYSIGYTPLEVLPRVAAVAWMLRYVGTSVRANPPQRQGAEAAVGRVVLALLLLYCLLPGTLAGWHYCSARFLLYAWLLLPLGAQFPPHVARRLPAIGPVLAALVLAIQWPFLRAASRQIQDAIDAGSTLPRGATIVPADFNVSPLGPQPTIDAWGYLVLEHDAVTSQVFASGRPRMGGERFRTLTFHPGVLDVATGALPWSGFEMWSDVWRPCAPPGSPARWFVHTDGTCADAVVARQQALAAVLDRYDYVLMLHPSEHEQELFASGLRLLRHVGAAWMYAVPHGMPAP